MSNPTDQAIHDHYWYHQDMNPFDGGTEAAYEYDCAYKDEERQEEFMREIFG